MLDGKESVTQVLFCAVDCVRSIVCRVLFWAVCFIFVLYFVYGTLCYKRAAWLWRASAVAHGMLP